MKIVNITIEYDHDVDTKAEHDFECYAAVNGSYYHDCLKSICKILIEYDQGNNKKKLTKEADKVLTDLRKQCATHFKGIYHDKK